ncbi:hypothetical protein D3C75_1157940 [compost metagenome]
MTGHQVMDSAAGWHGMPLVFQPALNLAGPPACVGGMGDAQQVGRDVRGLVRRMTRCPGAVLKTVSAIFSPAAKPLIGGGR